jgi:hypothetical protein
MTNERPESKDLPQFERYRRSQPTALLRDVGAETVGHSRACGTDSNSQQHLVGDEGGQRYQWLALPMGNVEWFTTSTTFADTVVRPSERKWQLRILPAQNRQWDTFLNVVQVSDIGTRLSMSWSAVMMHKQKVCSFVGSVMTTMVMFNAAPGPLLRTQELGQLCL